MTEAAKTMAVEDVLTSIRRLLAQDGPVAGEGADRDSQTSLENTLAALEAAMASRLTPAVAPEVAATDEVDPPCDAAWQEPAGEPPVAEAQVPSEIGGEPDLHSPAPGPVEAEPVTEAEGQTEPHEPALATPQGGVPADILSVAEEVEEAPFIAVDMPDAAPAPSFSFRHTAEVRRLQLVTPAIEEPGREKAEPSPDHTLETVRPTVALPVPRAEIPPAAEAIAPVSEAGRAAPDPVMPAATVDLAASVPSRRLLPSHASEEPRSLFHEPEDLPIDREVLRRLIGEVLREELQGTLGERMTRNVRKLVRAEIRRALAEGDAT